MTGHNILIKDQCTGCYHHIHYDNVHKVAINQVFICKPATGVTTAVISANDSQDFKCFASSMPYDFQ